MAIGAVQTPEREDVLRLAGSVPSGQGSITAPPGLGSATAASAALLLAIAGGALAGLALPPWGLPPLLWPALALLWQLAARRRRLALLLWGMTAVLVSHRWLLWLHPLDWIGVPPPLSLPLCLAIWGCCGLLGGALVLLWGQLVGQLGAWRLSSAVLAAAGWGLAEVLLARGPLFWLGLGASALPGDRALAGLASLGGAGLVALVQLLIGWCLWRALVGRLQGWRPLTLGLLLVLLTHGLGLAALALTPADAFAPERLAVLQPAIPTRRKFEPAQQQRLLDQLALLLDQLSTRRDTAAAGSVSSGEKAAGAVSAVLLPEGALALGQPLPRRPDPEVLAGGFRLEGDSLRSSLLRFGPGEQLPGSWLDKHRLVPLGEWVPFAGLLRWSGLSAVGGVDPGAAARLLPRPGGAIAVAICYELADGHALAGASRAGARWLLAAANLDPYPALLQRQYRALAQLRAIETGRWLVSAANTGPSLLVDPRGRVLAALAPDRAGSVELSLHPRRLLSPYDRWGEAPLLLLLAAAGWRRAQQAGGLPAAVGRC